MTGDSGENYDTLQAACAEARHTMDQQIEKIHREDQKAVKIFRVNLLILGVLISGYSISVQSSDISPDAFVNVHTVFGLAFMILSTLIGAMAYTSSNFEMGVNPTVIKRAKSMDNGDYYDKLTQEYSDWVQSNKSVHEFNAVAIALAMILAVGGLLVFMGGFYVGMKQVRGETISYVLLLVELIGSVILGILIYYSEDLFIRVRGETG